MPDGMVLKLGSDGTVQEVFSEFNPERASLSQNPSQSNLSMPTPNHAKKSKMTIQ
jgi:hypothetical protein